MLLSNLLKDIEHVKIKFGDREITGVAYDSRKVKAGDLFVAIDGFSDDGHKYIESALEKGAIAIIGSKEEFFPIDKDIAYIKVDHTREALAIAASNFFENPSQKFNLIGITGTNGKTSTTNLIKTILRSAGNKTGLLGTIENTLDDEIIPATHTTPESRDLQELFGTLAIKEADYCVMEVSSHALTLNRVLKADFKVGVFTNLTQDHLDFHKDMKDYFYAKKKLFSIINDIAAEDDTKKRYVVLNADDKYSKEIARDLSCNVLYYGIKNKAEYMAKDIQIGLNGLSFSLIYPGGKISIHLHMTGMFTVYNCLAAVAVAIEEGVEPDIIRNALQETMVPGRFELVRENQKYAVVVDYAHTPDSLENAIKTAREVADRRVITIFGCGGDRDTTKRPIMGKIGTELSDYSIVTSDNPRTEDPKMIIEDVLKGVHVSADKYETIIDRRKAIIKGINMAEPGDLVLIAGKGHEDYQIIGTKKYPFSDNLIAREAIRGRE